MAQTDSPHDPEAFAEKLRYWREGRCFPGVKYEHGGPAGKALFHDTTIRTEQRKIIEDAAKNGIQAVPAGSAG